MTPIPSFNSFLSINSWTHQKLIGTVIFICFPFSTDFQELARQNKITKQILEAYIQKKLGLRNGSVRAPSISDILTMKTFNESKKTKEKEPEEDYQQEEEQEEQGQEGQQEYSEDDSLQSVESEQIDSIYNEGMNPVACHSFKFEIH